MVKDDTAERKQRRFIKFSEVPRRWGGVSRIFVERKALEDPDFPPVYRFGKNGRVRFLDLEELEIYEQRSKAPRRRPRASMVASGG
jgi:hypothetical protein